MPSNSRVRPTPAISPSRTQRAPTKRQDPTTALPPSPGRTTSTSPRSSTSSTTTPDPGYPAEPAPLPHVDGLLHARPAQQARGAEYEPPDDELVLAAVALEAHGRDVLVRRALADGERLRQAEVPIALAARRGRGAPLRAAGQGRLPLPAVLLDARDFAGAGVILEEVEDAQGVLVVVILGGVVVVAFFWVGGAAAASGWGLVL